MECICEVIKNPEWWKVGIAICAAVFALIQYYTNSKFTRIANLSSLWKKFYERKEDTLFLEIFDALDKLEDDKGNIKKDKEDKLKSFTDVEKLRYLAYLADIVSFTKIGTVDKEHAKYLFHWHFYHVFINSNTKKCFWESLGGWIEHSSESWGDDYKFAKDCETYMKEKKFIDSNS